MSKLEESMKNKLFLNTISSFLLQIITLICGFILPRLILEAYGSETNGLVQSVAQFLGVISFLELGVGQVIQSALYRPLTQKDTVVISSVVVSGEKFFRRIAHILAVYVVILIFIYPLISNQNFGWFFTATLIISMCIGSFAQYYFGIIDKILLNADQSGYIQYSTQIIALILNTVLSVVIVKAGASIQFVKLTSSLVFLTVPVLLRLYINKHYNIDRKIKYEKEPITQKWNGIAQHISAFILNGTDTIVLTVFSTLSNVSIYSVYNMIALGMHQLYQAATNGLHSYIGHLWASQDLIKLNKVFAYVEMGLHFSTVFLFSCTGILIVPFVSVYTSGISDTNYIQPLFGVLMVIAHASQCLKTTYNMVILAGGHYKQVQSCHIVSAILNAAISVVGVYFYGLIGVAIGTVISMCYQLVWMAIYDSKNLIKWPIRNFIKQITVDIVTVFIIVAVTSWIELGDVNYFSWLFMAVKVGTIALLVTSGMAFVFYKKQIFDAYKWLLKKKRDF